VASEPPAPYGLGSGTWPGLAALSADAAQVLLAVRAIIAAGDDPGHQAALRDSLQDRLGDLRAAIDYVIGRNALDWDAVNRRRDRRRSRYERGIRERATPPATAAGNGRSAPRDGDGAGNNRPVPAGRGSAGDWPPAHRDNRAASPRDEDIAGGDCPAPRGEHGGGAVGRGDHGEEAAASGYVVSHQHARQSRAVPSRYGRRASRARAAIRQVRRHTRD
jgi:hypothetical protein